MAGPTAQATQATAATGTILHSRPAAIRVRCAATDACRAARRGKVFKGTIAKTNEQSGPDLVVNLWGTQLCHASATSSTATREDCKEQGGAEYQFRVRHAAPV